MLGRGGGVTPPSHGGGGVPWVPPTIHTWLRGYPIQSWWGVPGVPRPSRPGWGEVPHPVMGVPRVPHHPDLAGGYPIQSWWGYPRYPTTIQTWPGGYTPSSHGGRGYPGYPPPSRLGREVPHPVTMGRYPDYPPPSKSGPGVPWIPPTIRPGMMYPHHQTWDEVPPPHYQTWDGVPPTTTIRPGKGYPPPPTDGEQTDIPKYKYYLSPYYVRGR